MTARKVGDSAAELEIAVDANGKPFKLQDAQGHGSW